MFCHVNVHSYYSLLEGLTSPVDLVETAARFNMPALALTDHRMMTGSVEFALACQKNQIRPIFGLEIDLAWAGKVQPAVYRSVLLASSEEGWANLCRLSSAIHLVEPEVDVSLDMLARYQQDLILLSGDQGDETGRRLAQLGEIFQDRCYVAMPGPYYKLAVLAEKLRLPVVAAAPVYYRDERQETLQRTLSAIRLNCEIKGLPGDASAPAGAYFLPPSELRARFQEYPAALEATNEIAERCKFNLPLGVPHFPCVPIPPGMTMQQFLRGKAEEGARKYYGAITPEIQQRLEHELEVIANLQFEPIFLIVEEIMAYARKSGIPTSSRGSASSSLVAHCLGITTPDPLGLDLYFERFLNPARATPPDIDTDICSQGRDSLIEHVFDTYGAEHVAMVGTINHFRPRSAIADTAKAHGLAPERVRELANALPYAFWAKKEAEDGAGTVNSVSPFEDLRHLFPQYEAIYQDAEAILKLPRHLSVHPGGLVVAPGNVTDLVPVMRSGSKGITITQLDLAAVEAFGLVKIDLLGIRGLTVLGEVARAVYSWRRTEYAGPLDVLEGIPLDDVETAERIEHGQTIGCFQIESPGMRSVLKDIRARTPEDIMAALALYRPGPLQGGLKDAFVRRFKKEEPVTHLHPALEPLLQSTYGVILYQEQVLQIANRLAGFSLAEADLLRRAMSHFDPGKQMVQLQRKFIEGAQEKCGMPAEIGERVWEMMAAFAGYGFPKAHAASYALVSWRSAWCKTHFPAEFLAAVLANWGGYYSQRVYLSEARRMGLVVKAPHINQSKQQFSVIYPRGEAALSMGLDQVRDLTRRTQEQIIRLRPFKSLEDFLMKVDPRLQEAENLAQIGAMEGLGTIPGLLREIRKGGWKPGQMSLFGWQEGAEEDWTLEQRVQAQQEIVGVSLDAHPLELVAERIATAGAISIDEAIGKIGVKLRIAGVRQASHRSRTAKGQTMMFLTLEDLGGMIDVVIFPDLYGRVKNFIQTSQPLLITGMVEVDAQQGEPYLRAERIEKI
jgi:DNA polymerase III subunit alpha